VSRREAHLDAMLRHLGAAYYQTLQGQATAADVAQAVEAVTDFEARRDVSHAGPGEGNEAVEAGARARHPGRWRVREVMTTNVVTAERHMPYKQVAKLITEHHVNAVPVVAKGGRVLGIVSEADVLRKEERRYWRRSTGLSRHTRRERAKAKARTAGELMTSPAITIHPEAPLGAAAKLMNEHRIRRLPVVDVSGDLIGIVSRRDLLKVFLRPDEEIAGEVEGVLGSILLEDAGGVTVSVRDGVVTLDGVLAHKDLIPVTSRLASDVAGVVAVVSRLTHQEGPPRQQSASAGQLREPAPGQVTDAQWGTLRGGGCCGRSAAATGTTRPPRPRSP
jgi:CBS domain-containing protein